MMSRYTQLEDRGAVEVVGLKHERGEYQYGRAQQRARHNVKEELGRKPRGLLEVVRPGRAPHEAGEGPEHDNGHGIVVGQLAKDKAEEVRVDALGVEHSQDAHGIRGRDERAERQDLPHVDRQVPKRSPGRRNHPQEGESGSSRWN